jgi:hypothetical protein
MFDGFGAYAGQFGKHLKAIGRTDICYLVV